MKKKKLPKSLRKYIRKKKAQIRRTFLSLDQQKKEISKLYMSIFRKKI